MKAVDINVDIGEGFPFDDALLDFATSANVCCGAHAGSRELTMETLFRCDTKEVRVGMHPGFPDRDTMGRKEMEIDEVKQFSHSIFEQAIWFMEMAPDTSYIKPHGAFYNTLAGSASSNPAIYEGCKLILDGLMSFIRRSVMMMPQAPIVRHLRELDVGVITEGFADRAYAADGSLLPRSMPGAVLTNEGEIEEQVLRLAPNVDSICIHGDSPGCVETAELVYRTLLNADYEVGY